MTSDALIASLVVILIIVAWVQVHSLAVGGAANEAESEAKKMRLVAYADAVSRQTGAGNAVPTSTEFGIRDAQVKTWNLDENKPENKAVNERICMRRLVRVGAEAKILEVCA